MEFTITMDTMVSLILQGIDTIVTKNGRLKVFLDLVPSTKTRELNMP